MRIFVCLFSNRPISQVFSIIENFPQHLLKQSRIFRPVGFLEEKTITEYSLHSRLSNMLAHLTEL